MSRRKPQLKRLLRLVGLEKPATQVIGTAQS